MKLRNLLRITSLALGMAALAMATSVNVTFVGGYGSPLNGTVTNGSGEIYYPYVVNVNGNNLIVACDDINDQVDPTESWTATYNTFTDSAGSGLSGGAFIGQPSSLTNYQKAAWLFTQFNGLSSQPPNYNYDEENAAINYAIWDLFNGGNPQLLQYGSDPKTASLYWLDAATTAASNGFYGLDFSHFFLLTANSVGTLPNGTVVGTPQEYIGEVPEPASLALLGTGLLGLAFLFKRRLHEGSLDLQN